MRVGNSLYFDYQATTPVDPRVVEKMKPFFTNYFGNPHSFEHSVGWAAYKAVEDAAADISDLIGADPDELIFTSGATESNNLAILGLITGQRPRHKNRLLLSAIEHKSVLAASDHARRNHGMDVVTIPVDRRGRVVISALEGVMNEDVLLVSISAINNEIGTIQDISKIGEICRKWGTLLHCDVAQWFGGFDLDINRDHIDLLSLSGHKIYGPKGIGALFVSRSLQRRISPLIHGGGQQHGIRSGTVPVPLCVGMGEAARLIKTGDQDVALSKLRDRFTQGVIRLCEGTTVNGPEASKRHPGNTNIQFSHCSAQDLLASLQPRLAASSGSACTSGIPGASYVLRAIGLTEDEANASIRFSLGRFTTQEDVDLAINLVASAHHKCHKL